MVRLLLLLLLPLPLLLLMMSVRVWARFVRSSPAWLFASALERMLVNVRWIAHVHIARRVSVCQPNHTP
jgi:hypothetical protein